MRSTTGVKPKAASKPVKSLTASKPAKTLPASEPAKALPASKPAKTLAASKPAKTLAASKPAKTLTASKPAKSLPASKPVKTLPASKPVKTLPALKAVKNLPASKPVKALAAKPKSKADAALAVKTTAKISKESRKKTSVAKAAIVPPPAALAVADAGAPVKTGRVDRDQVQKAVASLTTWIKKQQKDKAKAELFEDDVMLHVVVSLKKIPADTRTNGHRIPLPHSLYPLGGDRQVCLIVKDDTRGEQEHKVAKERIAKEGGTGVTKVIGLSKLRSKYSQHEAKRQLCGSYDLFLADDRVICLLPKLLGKTFFKKRKHPIPVDLRGKAWSQKLRQACDSTYLYVGGGPCSVVRAARSDQSKDEIAENVMAVIEGIAAKVPKKWKNVQSLHLKTTDSLALPLYVAGPPVPTKIEL